MVRENETAITIRGSWNNGQANMEGLIDQPKDRYDLMVTSACGRCPPQMTNEGHRSGPQPERSKPIEVFSRDGLAKEFPEETK